MNTTYLETPSGLRVIHTQLAGYVEYCGLSIRAGSRNDPESMPGLAHFVEHTIFKGTAKRRSWHIINRMESVGGELNAYTTKEETMVYSIFPHGNLRRAVDLLHDLVTGSIFPQLEIDREREVVCDEINSYLDSPADAVFDEFEEMIFSGSPLAHNILGTTESVEKISQSDCRAYLNRYYRPDNMVFFYAGPEKAATVERLLKVFQSPSGHDNVTPAPAIPPTPSASRKTVDIGAHQSHTAMGALLPGMYEADRYAYALLTNILGGPGMNSRLNVALRERRGLVYTVDASTSLYTDTGLFTVYFGCDPDDTARCAKLVTAEIQQLADAPLSPLALERAKKQYLGQLMVASDNREQVTLNAARATLFHGAASTTDQVKEAIHNISPERILDASRALLPLSSLTLL